MTEKLIVFFRSGEMDTMNVTWSCPELGRGRKPPVPALVFSRTEGPRG